MKLNNLVAALLFILNASAQTQSGEQILEIQKKLSIESDQVEKAKLLNQAATYFIMRNKSATDIHRAEIINRQAMLLAKKKALKDIIAASMLVEGQIAMSKNNKDLGSKLKIKALEYAVKNGLRKQMKEIYGDIWGDYDHVDPKKKEFILKAIYLHKAAGNPVFLAGSYFDLGGYYHDIGKTDSMFKYMQKSIKIRKKIKSDNLYRDYTMMTRYYIINGDFKTAFSYCLQAEINAEKFDAAPIWRCTIYNLLGIIYGSLDDQPKSVIAYKKSIEMAKKSQNAFYVETIRLNAARNLYNYGKNYEALDILKDFNFSISKDCKVNYLAIYMLLYSEIGKYDTAMPYYEELLKCEVPEKDQLDIYMAIITYMLRTGQANKTQTYVDKLRRIKIINPNPKKRAQLEFTYFQADSASGNHTAALDHFKKYKEINDSIFNNNRTKQFDNLQVKYDTEKKDRNIKLLTEQGKLQKEVIKNATILRYVFIGGVAVLVLFTGLFYNRSRLKHRVNKKLRSKQQKINEQNSLLKKLLAEKEWLLKEIHHRVKNNLQIVISLLSTQSAYLENEDALLAIQKSQHRMYAMSLIHQKLYQSDDLASIDMSWYIHELVSYLKECFASGQKIDYKLDTDSVELDVTQAVPLGLILNEAISNAIKYAFNGKDKGQISISLKSVGPEIYKLMIADNGPGLPKDFHSQENESLGMNLMTGLTHQLNGTLELENSNGLAIFLTFTKKMQLYKL